MILGSFERAEVVKLSDAVVVLFCCYCVFVCVCFCRMVNIGTTAKQITDDFCAAVGFD